MKIMRWLSTGNLGGQLPETEEQLAGMLCNQFEGALQNSEVGVVVCQLEDGTYRKAFVEINLGEIDEEYAQDMAGEMEEAE